MQFVNVVSPMADILGIFQGYVILKANIQLKSVENNFFKVM